MPRCCFVLPAPTGRGRHTKIVSSSGRCGMLKWVGEDVIVLGRSEEAPSMLINVQIRTATGRKFLPPADNWMEGEKIPRTRLDS